MGLTEDRIREFERRRVQLMAMGGEKMILKQYASGKLTARERLDLLFDQGTFQEVQLFVKHRSTLLGLGKKEINADGVITGFGKVNGRTVFAAAQDFTSAGGSLGEMHARKIWKVMDMAIDAKKPLIALNDSGGARIQEGVPALDGYAGIFRRNTTASGYIPQITAIMGHSAGGAVYSPALTDWVFMVKGSSYMYITVSTACCFGWFHQTINMLILYKEIELTRCLTLPGNGATPASSGCCRPAIIGEPKVGKGGLC